MSDKKPAQKKIPKKTKFNFDWALIERVMPTEQGLGRPASAKDAAKKR